MALRNARGYFKDLKSKAENIEEERKVLDKKIQKRRERKGEHVQEV